MPYGRYGAVTYITNTCPICTKEHTERKGRVKLTCSMTCGIKLKQLNKRKTYKKWHKNKIRIEHLLELKVNRQEKELHLRVMIGVDNYGEGEVL